MPYNTDTTITTYQSYGHTMIDCSNSVAVFGSLKRLHRTRFSISTCTRDNKNRQLVYFFSDLIKASSGIDTSTKPASEKHGRILTQQTVYTD